MNVEMYVFYFFATLLWLPAIDTQGVETVVFYACYLFLYFYLKHHYYYFCCFYHHICGLLSNNFQLL